MGADGEIIELYCPALLLNLLHCGPHGYLVYNNVSYICVASATISVIFLGSGTRQESEVSV